MKKRALYLTLIILAVVGIKSIAGCGSAAATAILNGTVTNAGGSPLVGAIAYFTGYTTTFATDASGNFQAALTHGQLTVKIVMEGYDTYVETFTLEAGTSAKQFQLTTWNADAGLTGTLQGVVRCDESSDTIQGAVVTIEGTELSDTTDDQGSYLIENVPSGTQTINIDKAGYFPYGDDQWLFDNFTNIHNARLEPE